MTGERQIGGDGKGCVAAAEDGEGDHDFFLVTNLFAHSNPLGGAVVGFFLWLGFAGAIALTGHVSSDRPWGIYLMDTMYQLVYLTMIGAIVGGWR